MINILELLNVHARKQPDAAAVQSNGECFTYNQLQLYSNRLALYLLEHIDNRAPIIVYGHKHPLMLVCFLACVKSGHAYCPIDITVPDVRVQAIIDAVDPPIILAVAGMEHEEIPCLAICDLQKIINNSEMMQRQLCPVRGEDTFYIIFTSGSTGIPKGVQITSNCLNNYLEWAVDLGVSRRKKQGAAFLNQAPFSFDLSVMDLYTCLACGGTLWTLDREMISDYKRMFAMMKEADINVWVSTPSFAEMCLTDHGFNQELIPGLNAFLFCGETLANHTAGQLLKRFPNATVINTYGPTESTVAVTDIKVTAAVIERYNPLPVGKAKKGSFIEIWDCDGNLLKDGQPGEIVIIGDTVSPGYFRQKELTDKVFFDCLREGVKYRGYHTGDEGYLSEGQLFYCGRMDLQIKLHGYRIELEDIEQNILNLEHVKNTAVTPNIQEGKVKSLTAHIIYDMEVDNKFKTGQLIKSSLKNYLPDYMIPKKINFLTAFPMTINGKCDRKKLGGQMN